MISIIVKTIRRLLNLRIRAISFIEIAISLSIIGIITSMMLNIFNFFQHKQHEAEVKYHLHEISVAAARYAADHGYLPLPGEQDNELNETLEFDHSFQLKGDVPWRKLGLKAEPIVNGKKFTWIVAVTAIKRQGWKYYPSEEAVHLSPVFWSNIKDATFARPRWCGVSRYPWYGEPSRSLGGNDDIYDYFNREYLKDRKYNQYVINPVIKNNLNTYEYEKITPNFSYLIPRLRHAAPLGTLMSAGLAELYKLEMDVTLFSQQKTNVQEFYNGRERVINALLSENYRELHSAAFYGRIFRTVWINELVLAISYDMIEPKREQRNYDDNPLAVVRNDHTVIWSRLNLLALIGVFAGRSYTHPGYKWDRGAIGRDICIGYGGVERKFLEQQSMPLLPHIPIMSPPSKIYTPMMVVLNRISDSDKFGFSEHLLSAFMTEWMQAVLLIDGLCLIDNKDCYCQKIIGNSGHYYVSLEIHPERTQDNKHVFEQIVARMTLKLTKLRDILNRKEKLGL